jgi:hypothetical protein
VRFGIPPEIGRTLNLGPESRRPAAAGGIISTPAVRSPSQIEQPADLPRPTPLPERALTAGACSQQHGQGGVV